MTENGTKKDTEKQTQTELMNENKEKKPSVWEFRPVPTIHSTVTCFVIFGIIFLVLGILILYVSNQIKDIEVRYDNIDECSKAFVDTKVSINSTNIVNIEEEADLSSILKFKLKNHQCMINFTLFEQLDSPIYIYYELDNFYQNHRRFIKSFSINQLAGSVLNSSQIEDDCSPIVTVKDLGINKTIGGYYLEPDAPANPCGLYPRSFFNDTYSIYSANSGKVFINETGIAYPSDKNSRFISPLNAERLQWLNVSDEHFMVWMRPAATSNFRKLWGRIENNLEPGNYSLLIDNYYDVEYFGGKKTFVISTSSILGGRNTFLGTCFIILAAVCLLSGALFAIAYYNMNVDSNKKND